MENLRKNNQTEILEIKKSLNQIKYSLKLLQHIRTSGRQNFRTQRQKDIKEKNRRIVRKRHKCYKKNTQKLSDFIKDQTCESWA
jgi:hypothetical protein